MSHEGNEVAMLQHSFKVHQLQKLLQSEAAALNWSRYVQRCIVRFS